MRGFLAMVQRGFPDEIVRVREPDRHNDSAAACGSGSVNLKSNHGFGSLSLQRKVSKNPANILSNDRPK